MDILKRFKNKTFIAAMVAYALLIATQLGCPLPSYAEMVIMGFVNLLVLLGIVIDPSKPKMEIDWRKNLANPVFGLAVIAYIIMLSTQTGWFALPSNFDVVSKTIIDMLIFLGVLVNPSTPGLKD